MATESVSRISESSAVRRIRSRSACRISSWARAMLFGGCWFVYTCRTACSCCNCLKYQSAVRSRLRQHSSKASFTHYENEIAFSTIYSLVYCRKISYQFEIRNTITIICKSYWLNVLAHLDRVSSFVVYKIHRLHVSTGNYRR